MNKKFFVGVTAFTLMMSGVLCGCGNNMKPATDQKTTDSDVDVLEATEAEVIPNKSEDFIWHEITEEEIPDLKGGILITAYLGSGTEVMIPKFIDGKPVVAIGDFAFSPLNADDILKSGDEIPSPDLKLTLLKVVGLIENEPYDDSEIKNIKRSINDDEIGEALEQCTPMSDVKQVLIPNTVSYIGGCSFAFCGSLETVKVYDVNEDVMPVIKVDNISGSGMESYPFYACNSLKETNFYLDADECGTDSCYNYCTNLKRVYLYPNFRNEVRLGNWGIYTLSNLEGIMIEDGCTYIYNAISYKKKDFSGCTFYIPASVTEMDNHIFCTHINNGEYDHEGSPDVEDCTMCDNITIVTPSGSYAESYAKANNIPYRNE